MRLKCSITQKELYGDFGEKEKCDFLSVVIIRLSGKDNSDPNNELIDMLTILLSEKMDAETKKHELETKYGMIMTEEVEGGISSMCNLGEGLMEKYEKKGEEKLVGLISSLLSEGLTDAITLVISNEVAREEYYKRYGIE